MSTKDLGDLGVAAGDIFAKALRLVEDVRAVVDTFAGMDPEFPSVQAAHRLRALFPATEPAEEPAREGDCALLPTHNGPCRPAPAEPAEEETKAEGRIGGAPDLRDVTEDETQRTYDEAVSLSYWLAKQLTEHVDDAYDRGETLTDTVQRLIEHIRPNLGKTKTASSPVVPAPTETGPWQTWQEVPEGVKYSPKARPPAGSPLRLLAQPLWVNRGGTRYQARSGSVSKIGDVEMFHYAPFVASVEEQS